MLNTLKFYGIIYFSFNIIVIDANYFHVQLITTLE